MGRFSRIEWCHHTFNPWTGCAHVSPGCERCYAERDDARWHGDAHWGVKAARLFRSDAYWREPLRWNRAALDAGERQRVFCASFADVMEDREDLYSERLRLWSLVHRTPHLDWLILTKRPQNFERFLPWTDGSVYRSVAEKVGGAGGSFPYHEPWPNVWLGVTAEDQRRADERLPILCDTRAAVRFVSYEPALEYVEFQPWLGRFDWLIAGSESGPGARPASLDWYRAVRDRVLDDGHRTAFFLKQHVDRGIKYPTPKIDGETWTEFPR